MKNERGGGGIEIMGLYCKFASGGSIGKKKMREDK